MMTFDLEFDSDHFAKDGECALIQITIDVRYSRDEGSSVESMELFDETNQIKRELEDFPGTEQLAIEALCNSLMEEKDSELAEDQAGRDVDYAYDMLREG